MNGLNKTILALLVVCLFFLPSVISDSTDASPQMPFKIVLQDSEGNDLDDPLFGGGSVSYIDTITSSNGTKYRVITKTEIKTVPAHFMIEASGGQYNSTVSISGSSEVIEAGLRVTLTNGTNSYVADLTAENNGSSAFRNSGNGEIAVLNPNTDYSVSISIIDAFSSATPPESLATLKITFQASTSNGYHQVVFVSEDETVESYTVSDAYIIQSVPEVSRTGYIFQGWFTADEKSVTKGYYVGNDCDVISYANYESENAQDGSDHTLFVFIADSRVVTIAIGSVVSLIAAVIIAVIVFRLTR